MGCALQKEEWIPFEAGAPEPDPRSSLPQEAHLFKPFKLALPPFALRPWHVLEADMRKASAPAEDSDLSWGQEAPDNYVDNASSAGGELSGVACA